MVYSKIIKRTTARLISPLLFYSRSYFLSKHFYSGLGSILTFHRVCPENSKPRIRGTAGLEVTPEYLENTIRFLHHNNYEIVSMTGAAKILKTGNNDKKFAVFTFDDGYIDNLPSNCCVEVPCMINAKGISHQKFGRLPEHLAAMMRTNINVQMLTAEAAMTKKREHIYHAALLDPLTAANLTIDEIYFWSRFSNRRNHYR